MLPNFDNLTLSVQSFRGGYATSKLSTHSPFLGVDQDSHGYRKGFLFTEMWRLANQRGMDAMAVRGMCSVMGVPCPPERGESDDPYWDAETVRAGWIAMCREVHLMHHLAPPAIAADPEVSNMVRLLYVGDATWSWDDVAKCCRAVLHGCGGYSRLETRIVIRNEYDDQSYSDQEVLRHFLMKPTDRVGFGGDEIDLDGWDKSHAPMTSFACHVNDSYSKLLQSKGLEHGYNNSFIYDIRTEEFTSHDLASGVSVGR